MMTLVRKALSSAVLFGFADGKEERLYQRHITSFDSAWRWFSRAVITGSFITVFSSQWGWQEGGAWRNSPWLVYQAALLLVWLACWATGMRSGRVAAISMQRGRMQALIPLTWLGSIVISAQTSALCSEGCWDHPWSFAADLAIVLPFALTAVVTSEAYLHWQWSSSSQRREGTGQQQENRKRPSSSRAAVPTPTLDKHTLIPNPAPTSNSAGPSDPPPSGPVADASEPTADPLAKKRRRVQYVSPVQLLRISMKVEDAELACLPALNTEEGRALVMAAMQKRLDAHSELTGYPRFIVLNLAAREGCVVVECDVAAEQRDPAGGNGGGGEGDEQRPDELAGVNAERLQALDIVRSTGLHAAIASGNGPQPVTVSAPFLTGAPSQVFYYHAASESYTLERSVAEASVPGSGAGMSCLSPQCLVAVPSEVAVLEAWVPSHLLERASEAPARRWEALVAGQALPLTLVHEEQQQEEEEEEEESQGCEVRFEVAVSGEAAIHGGRLWVVCFQGNSLAASQSLLLLPAEHTVACGELALMLDDPACALPDMGADLGIVLDAARLGRQRLSAEQHHVSLLVCNGLLRWLELDDDLPGLVCMLRSLQGALQRVAAEQPSEVDMQQQQEQKEEPAPALASAPAISPTCPFAPSPVVHRISPIWAACVSSVYFLTSAPGLLTSPGRTLLVISLFSWSHWCVLLLGFGQPRRPPMRSSGSSPAVAAVWRAYEWVTVENWGLVMLLSQACNAGLVLSGACTLDIFVCGVMHRYSSEPITLRWLVVRLLFGSQETFDLRAAVPVLLLHASTQVPMLQEVGGRSAASAWAVSLLHSCLLLVPSLASALVRHFAGMRRVRPAHVTGKLKAA